MTYKFKYGHENKTYIKITKKNNLFCTPIRLRTEWPKNRVSIPEIFHFYTVFRRAVRAYPTPYTKGTGWFLQSSKGNGRENI